MGFVSRASLTGLLAGVLSLCVGCPDRGAAPPGVSPTPSASTGTPGARELEVLAAASLGQPLKQIVTQFEASRPGLHVALSLGSSSALERQIEQGAACDVFISAATAPVDRLVAKSLLDPATRVVVARNSLVVIVPVGDSPAAPPVARIEDLVKLERVAVGQSGVPVGEYAREALGRAGLADGLKEKLAGYPDEPSVVTAVAEGGAAAGLVYASSLQVHPRRDRVAQAFVVSETLHAPIVYPGAVGAGARARADATALLEYLRVGPGRELLQAGGFLVDGAP